MYESWIFQLYPMNSQTPSFMPLAKVKQKGQVTIPAKLRGELGLAEGDYVDISREGSRIVLTPKETVDRHPVIDAALAEAFADEQAGRVSPEFKTIDEFQTWRKTEDYKKLIGKK
jgi:AbrB family looped-hinge helix DNA binding protein